MQYSNKFHYYFFEILWGLGWILAIYFMGAKGTIFFVFIALRPFLLKTEPLKPEEIDWRERYYIVLHTVIATSCVVILFYVFSKLFLSDKFLYNNRFMILYIIILPLFILIRGITGIIYLMKSDGPKIILK